MSPFQSEKNKVQLEGLQPAQIKLMLANASCVETAFGIKLDDSAPLRDPTQTHKRIALRRHLLLTLKHQFGTMTAGRQKPAGEGRAELPSHRMRADLVVNPALNLATKRQMLVSTVLLRRGEEERAGCFTASVWRNICPSLSILEHTACIWGPCVGRR